MYSQMWINSCDRTNVASLDDIDWSVGAHAFLVELKTATCTYMCHYNYLLPQIHHVNEFNEVFST